MKQKMKIARMTNVERAPMTVPAMAPTFAELEGVEERGVEVGVEGEDSDVPVSVGRLFAKRFFTSGVFHCMDAVPLLLSALASRCLRAK